jgi:histone-lysine N-methyltransferase SETMAR
MEEPTVTKSKIGASGLEFNKEHAHYFFDMKWIFHHEFVPSNTTVNSDFYCDVWDTWEKMYDEQDRILAQPQLTPSSWQCTHPHIPENHKFVTNICIVIVPHLPYSLDLAPSDFTLFPKLKMKLKGLHFETVSDI